MARYEARILVFAVAVALLASQCRCQPPGMKQKVTNLHFFFHDIPSGDKPTAVQVAAPKNLSSLVKEKLFGTIMAIDDPLTEGPEADSKVLGSAQGYYIISGQDSPMLVLAADYGFTTGPYNGSSFSVFSRNPAMDTDRELAVVGGRGAFRMAQGIAKLHTHSIDTTTGDAVVEYNVTLFHYE
ncbi:hypothetical protein BHE74_00011471 [Ensete ventricosum]|nr:hypothetical protein BHE74_00011471 [Ensete ventricosum]